MECTPIFGDFLPTHFRVTGAWGFNDVVRSIITFHDILSIIYNKIDEFINNEYADKSAWITIYKHLITTSTILNLKAI